MLGVVHIAVLTLFVCYYRVRLKNRERTEMPKRTKPMTQLNVAFPDPVIAQIKKLARERDESESLIVRELVKKSLDVA